MKIGDKVKVHAYKHDGKLHSISDNTIILDITDDMVICGNSQTTITEGDGRSYKTNETALIFFYKDNWFNILCQFKKYGIFYYCNIASPYILDKEVIKYIDYDLDLRVFPDGGFKVLDKNEYKYHKKIFNYSTDLDRVIKSELTKLIEIKKKNEFPFKEEDVKRYYELFNEMNNK